MENLHLTVLSWEYEILLSLLKNVQKEVLSRRNPYILGRILIQQFIHFFIKILSSLICSYPAHFLASALKTFFPKKALVWKSFLYFLKTAFLIFRKRNFLIFSKKKKFLIFREGYIQNPIVFRTLANIYDRTFCKNSYLPHFWTQARNIKKFLIFSQKKLFLYFSKRNFLIF